MFSSKALLATTLLLSAVACAPRVSRRAPEPLAAKPAPVQHVVPVQTAKAEPVVVAQPVKAQPVVVAQPVKAEPAKAQPAKAQPVKATIDEEAAEHEVEESAEEEQGYAHEEPKASNSKKSFYAYSDDEITSMRRKSREFKKLHDKLNTCTSRSERTIAKREQLRDKIIALQNTEYRTPRQDKELQKLRADERKMLSGRADNTQDCHALEGRLTEMLRGAYAQGA